MLAIVWRWLERLFGLAKKGPHGRPSNWPTKEKIETLPPFDALELEDIVEVVNPRQARQAEQELTAEEVVGFDTESKPTFLKGQVSTGPHVAQFSTRKRAYVFMLHDPECRRAAARLISAAALKKVGFGLSGDLRQIRSKLRIEPQEVYDLDALFAEKGYGRGVGVKVGVAITMKRRFFKSKKASTSNWMSRRLTDKQILYAANDAYAALEVFHALTSR